VATLLGAFRLGWQRTYWCGQFGASYLHGAWAQGPGVHRTCWILGILGAGGWHIT
jgi:hypothetical protein